MCRSSNSFIINKCCSSNGITNIKCYSGNSRNYEFLKGNRK